MFLVPRDSESEAKMDPSPSKRNQETHTNLGCHGARCSCYGGELFCKVALARAWRTPEKMGTRSSLRLGGEAKIAQLSAQPAELKSLVLSDYTCERP